MTLLRHSEPQRYYCRTCGIVRDSDVAPWCRHNDPDRRMPATRMVPIPAFHPLARRTT